MTYLLDDADALHRESPRTFGVPRLSERSTLRVGQLVKLIFRDPDPPKDGFGAERMWVEVTAVEGDGPARRYRGRLDNDPRQLRLRAGDEIAFEPRHVASIYVKEGEATHVDLAEWAIASRRVLDEGRWPAVVYRAAPLAEHDSGLRVLAGDEDAATLRDAHAFRPIVLHTLVATNAAYDSILGERARVSFRWDEARCEFVRAPFRSVRRLDKGMLRHAYRHRTAPAPSAFRRGLRVLVDDRVLSGVAPEYVYREATDREDDSGFRVFANGDYDAFVASGSGTTFVPAMRALRDHPRLDLVFGTKHAVGDWEWEHGRGRWLRSRE